MAADPWAFANKLDPWAFMDTHMASEPAAAQTSSQQSVARAKRTRAEILEEATAAERARRPSQARATAALDKRHQREHETADERCMRILSDEYAAAIFCGCHVNAKRELVGHKEPCQQPLPAATAGGTGKPCWHNLWDFEELKAHLRMMASKSPEARSQYVYERLHDCFYAEIGSDGKPMGVAYWHFRISGRLVCRDYFAACHGIGLSTLDEKLARMKRGRAYAHAKREEGTSGGERERSCDTKALTVIAWTQVYASEVGDYMPHLDQTIIPVRDLLEEHKEYAAGRPESETAGYAYFCQIRRTAPELRHICHARKCFNFQHCRECVNCNAELAAAIATGNADAIAQAKAKRAAHHRLSRGERSCYYERREAAMAHPLDSLSVIIDKWDSSKSTSPFFARTPAACWKEAKKHVLHQHVLGLLVHGKPYHSAYLYTFNDSIAGDANVNIEGLRRMLASRHATIPMPRRFDVQADNASDNKNWAVFLFLAMLVYYGYTDEVYFSFLIVGHTHEDIDQLFSVISRFLRGLPPSASLTPSAFAANMRDAIDAKFQVTSERMVSVLDWRAALTPSLHTGIVGIQHRLLEVDNEEQQRAPHTFWIHRRSDGHVVFHYKEYAQQPVWLPPIDSSANPLVTDPQGIEIFSLQCPPPDPMKEPPSEVPLFAV